MTTSTAYVRSASFLRKFVIGIGWIGWLILVIGILPYAHLKIDQDPEIPFLIIGGILFLLAIPLTIGSAVDLLRSFRRYFLPILGVGTVTAILYLLPNVLWSQGTIFAYRTAVVFSLILTGISLFVGYGFLKQPLPVMPRL